MKTWWVCIIVISIVTLAMFIWAIVSYVKPRNCRCEGCDAFPYGKSLREGYKRFKVYDENLSSSMALTCQQVLAFWQRRGLEKARLLGSCIHRTWTPASDIDISVPVTSVEELHHVRQILEKNGAHVVHEANNLKETPFVLYRDPAWSRPVDISVAIQLDNVLNSKYLENYRRLDLPDELRFLISYLKNKYTDFKFNVKQQK